MKTPEGKNIVSKFMGETIPKVKLVASRHQKFKYMMEEFHNIGGNGGEGSRKRKRGRGADRFNFFIKENTKE